MYKRLPKEEKLEIIRRIKSGEKVSKVCKEAGVSRTILYRWLKPSPSPSPSPLGRGYGVRASSQNDGSRQARTISFKHRHWKRLPTPIENKIIKTALKNPALSPLELARSVNISPHGVWNVLKRNNLNTRQTREIYIHNNGSSLIRSLGVNDRVTMMRRLEAGEKVSDICRDFKISRTVFYKWLKRYKEAQKREALESQRPKGENHWRFVPGASDLVLQIIVEHPEFSAQKISSALFVQTGKKILGNHGVHNLLTRLNLNTYQRRQAFAQSQEAPITPAPQVTRGWRIPIFGEIPSVSALAPPSSYFKKLISSKFFVSFLSVIIIGFASSVLLSNLGYGQGFVGKIGILFSFVALFFGMFFFIYSLKYYLTIAIVLSFSRRKEEGNRGDRGNRGDKAIGLKSDLSSVRLQRHPFVSIHIACFNEKRVIERLLKAASSMDYDSYEVVLVDDSNDETSLIIADYISKGIKGKESIKSIKGNGFTLISAEIRNGVVLKHLHRSSREGFKGGALREALKHTDTKAEFVMVLDADFIPYPDTIVQFLKYFQATSGTLDFTNSKFEYRNSKQYQNTNDQNSKQFRASDFGFRASSRIAAVQGYQWHVLNKSENWITRGVRSEYSGSYVIERSGEEIYAGLKQISGSVYMIKREILEKIGWGTSITEDFQLTLKLYELGYKVVYTPYIQAPAEAVSTIKRLIRQRMRWAEGHSHNIKKMFGRLLFGRWEEEQTIDGRELKVGVEGRSSRIDNLSSILNPQPLSSTFNHLPSRKWIPSPLSLAEKLEFIYLSPYYLQAAFFIFGTLSWFIAEVIFKVRLPFWTEVWGWSLVFTNLLALPLMNMVGLFMEESEERDYLGLFSFIILSYIVAPFQGYAALKGFLAREEGPWFRTPKTGRITDTFIQGRLYRWVRGIFGGRVAPSLMSADRNADLRGILSGNQYLSIATINSNLAMKQFNNSSFFIFPFFGRRSVRFAYRHVFTKSVLAVFLAITMMLNYMAFLVYDTQTPISAEKEPIIADKESALISEAPSVDRAENQRSSAGSGASGGQTIAAIKDNINTNLVENPSALAMLEASRPGQAYAAEKTLISADGKQISAEEVYRWVVELSRGTTYYFGLQEPGGVRPVVKMRNKEGWWVRYEPHMRMYTNDNTANESESPSTSSGQDIRMDSDYSHSDTFVSPKVDGNSIEWTLPNGIIAKYTSLGDRIKADYIVKDGAYLCPSPPPSPTKGEGVGISSPLRGEDKGEGEGAPCSNPRLDFIVQYNDSYAGDSGEELINGAGYLKHELLPDGSITWLKENGGEVFTMPKPIVKEEQTVEDGTLKVGVEDRSSKIDNHHLSSNDLNFTIQKTSTGTSLLSIVLPDNVDYPLTIDPVVVDSVAAATATAYGNGRKLLKDAFGNLIVMFDGTLDNGSLDSEEDVWYKNKSDDNVNAGVWTDANIDLNKNSSWDNFEVSADLDSAGNVHYANRDANTSSLIYFKLTVTRDGSNNITSISQSQGIGLDNSDKATKPSLIIANKNEGAGKEKVAVAWAMNSTSGGTKRGEIRFAQCDVADGCEAGANLKNASEEVNMSGTCTDGTAGIPNAINCAGAADVLFQYTAGHTTHHAVLTQVPGRPARTPKSAKFFDGATSGYTNMTTAIDDNTATADTNPSSMATNDFIYIGDDNKFSRIVVDVTNTNTNTGGTTIGYCSANSDIATTCDTWTTVSNTVQNTGFSGGLLVPFNEDGSLLFDEPSNWVQSTENTVQGNWVRVNPGQPMDSSVSIAELEVTDRHSKDLLVVGGVDATDDLGTAYVIWDFVGQAGWENNPADADDPWRSNAGTLSGEDGANWGEITNFPLTITADLINNIVYVALHDCNGASCSTNSEIEVYMIVNTKDLTVAGSWVNSGYPGGVEGLDMVLTFTSDQSDIYLVYVLNPDTNGLVWRKCTPSGGGDGNRCDVGADWGAENTLSAFSTGAEEPSHPQAIVSKAYGDTVAMDVVYTNLLATATVKYERHLVDMADITEVIQAITDNVGQYTSMSCPTATDCKISYYDVTNTALLFRDCNDATCSTSTVTILDGNTGCVLTSCSTTADVGQYTSISCPTATDCKISYKDVTNTSLKFADCDDATCSTGAVTILDGNTGCVLTSCSTTANDGDFNSINCPTATDCKISYRETSLGGDLKFADCDTATCSSGTVTLLDGNTGCVLTNCSTTANVANIYTSISCPTATDCKISYQDSGNNDLLFADCDTATCSSGTVTLLDGNTGCVLTSCSTTDAVGSYSSIACPTATDCKISYFVGDTGELKFADCDTATCSSGTVTLLDGNTGCVLTSCSTTSDVGQYTSISCPTAADCKISYRSGGANFDLKFADCDTATCSSGTVTLLDGNTGCVLTSCSTTADVGNFQTSISCPTDTDCKISYYDDTGDDLKFADCDTATCSTGTATTVGLINNDAYHRDCDTGTDDQDITSTTVKLGREIDDASCSPTTEESRNHVGFRFTTVNIAQGARISSAYLDFRVLTDNATSAVGFTIYGEDTDDSSGFSVLTDCTDPCSGVVEQRTQTTSSTAQSINFQTNSYRIDVTDLVQEIVCRGINDTQPCVGNFNGNGLTAWAANNNLALLLIATGSETADNNALITAQDDTATVMLDPTLQINCSATCSSTGSVGRNYTMGLRYPHQGSGSTSDLDHPISALQFGQVGTEGDTLFASMSASMVHYASTSAVPMYIFKANNSNNNNTDDITITVILKSSIPAKSYGGPHASGREMRLEVYNNDASPNWDPVDTDTTSVADTDITLTGTVTGATSYYQSYTPGGSCTGNDCWATLRVWQDRAYDANQIFYVDLVSFVFVPEKLLWLLPFAMFLPRIVQWYNRRRLRLKPAMILG